MHLTTETVDRDTARDFATTIRAARALAKQGRAQAEAVRNLVKCTRVFARVHRTQAATFAGFDRVHNLAQRAIAQGIAPPSVHAWAADRYSRVRLETARHE